jgi:3,4-dihydroxy 2-butanone 4-phosphate synthase/GTP cyclohydrolase II
MRAGHTEAGCDLARLAGLEPAAVVVEILNEDGTMARRPDLEKFAKEHDLKLGSIADLIKYRMLHEKTVQRIAECDLPTEYGDFHLVAYQDTVDNAVHLALVKGQISPEKPTLIRVHVRDVINDLAHSRRDDTGWPLPDALQRVAETGQGVVVILNQQESTEELVQRIRIYQAQDDGEDVPAKDSGEGLRTYGLGAQILTDLGVRKMRVLSAPRRIHGISGFGLEVVEYVQ